MAGITLGIDGVVFLVQAFVGGFARIDRTALLVKGIVASSSGPQALDFLVYCRSVNEQHDHFFGGAYVKKLTAIVSTLFILSVPALAVQTEEIGKLNANFGGETITQPTVLAKQGGKSSPTAFLIVPGGGLSNLNFVGYSLDNKRLGLEVSFMTEKPDTKTAPFDLTITYSPKGTKEHWTSEDAPSSAKIMFTTLEMKGDEGRAAGTFEAVLCYAKDHSSGADTKNCRPIEGSFETKVFLHK